MKHKTIMSLAAVLPLAWNPTVGAADRPDAAAIKNPSTVVEHRGELRIFTPDRKRWQPSFEDYVWEEPKLSRLPARRHQGAHRLSPPTANPRRGCLSSEIGRFLGPADSCRRQAGPHHRDHDAGLKESRAPESCPSGAINSDCQSS